MMKIMTANYDVLKKRMPEFLAMLMQPEIGQSETVRAEAAAAKDGSIIDILNLEGQQYVMQSRYKPVEEAKRFVKQFHDIKPDTCMLFLGFGNGYIARELIEHKTATFVFYEPSLAYFLYVLQIYDVSDILSAEHIHIYVEGINRQLLSHDMYGYVHALNWPVFYLEALPKYRQLFPAAMNQLAELYQESRQHAQQNYDVDIRFAEKNLYNAIHNLEYIYTGHSICDYEQILRPEIPVIIVAAGPSLEKNVRELKEYRNKAFILCVDRAAPVLAKEGILPHAYVTADAVKETFLFADEQSAKVPWFAYTTSNYDALKMLSGTNIIFSSSIYAYAYELFQHVGSDIYTLANGGSVATVAVNVALQLGSRRIVLVGQDLALTSEKVHAGEDAIDLSQVHYDTIEVPGYYGDMVRTREDYKAYIDWYEAFSAKHPEITFVNATEGGAYLSGMEHMCLRDAMSNYGVDGFDGDEVLASVGTLMTPEHQKIIAGDYIGLLSYFKKVKREVATAITWMERGVNILQTQGLAGAELDQVEKQMERFQAIYNGHTGKTILDLNIAKEIQEALLDVHFHEKDATKELLRLYRKMLAFFKGVESAVGKALPMLKEVLETLQIE